MPPWPARSPLRTGPRRAHRIAAERAGWHRAGWRRWGGLVVTIGVLGLVVPTVIAHLGDRVRAETGLQTVAVIPYWNLTAGVNSVLAHRDVVSQVSPWTFGVSDDGHLIQLAPDQIDQQLAQQRLAAAGVTLMPTIANYRNGHWQYAPVARILHSPDLMRRHIDELVALATGKGWAGLNIDYEELHADDRDAFTSFVRALARALHDADLALSLDVFAKTTDAGYDQRNRAQDYAALGEAADQVRLMAYDYHWSTSAPGPIAPIDWISGVLGYARSQIPAEKLVLGIPFYGYDWVAHTGRPVSWTEVYDLARVHGYPIRWDQASQSPTLSYTDANGSRHEVWFENSYSSAVKFTLARSYGVHGVSLWMYGPEDEATWNKLRQIGAAAGHPTGGAR